LIKEEATEGEELEEASEGASEGASGGVEEEEAVEEAEEEGLPESAEADSKEEDKLRRIPVADLAATLTDLLTMAAAARADGVVTLALDAAVLVTGVAGLLPLRAGATRPVVTPLVGAALPTLVGAALPPLAGTPLAAALSRLEIAGLLLTVADVAVTASAVLPRAVEVTAALLAPPLIAFAVEPRRAGLTAAVEDKLVEGPACASAAVAGLARAVAVPLKGPIPPAVCGRVLQEHGTP